MKKSFMTRVLAVSLSAAMAFSLSSATSLTAPEAAAKKLPANNKAVSISLKVGKSKVLKLKNYKAWNIKSAKTSKKAVAAIANKGTKAKRTVKVTAKKAGTAKVTLTLGKRKTANSKATKYSKTIKKVVTVKVTKAADTTTPTDPTPTDPTPTDPTPVTPTDSAVNVTPGALNISQVAATKVDTLVVSFSSVVASTGAVKIDVTRGTSPVEVKSITWNAEANAATIEMTAKMIKGTYNVSATDGKETTTGSVEVENQDVKEIKFLNETALTGHKAGTTETGATQAYVYYDVLDQYGESMRDTVSIQWTTSADSAEVDRAKGRLTIRKKKTVGTSEVFNFGDKIYVTGVYTKTGVSNSATFSVGTEQSVDTIKFQGFIKKGTTTILDKLPSDFKTNEYQLLYTPFDQNGNEIDALDYVDDEKGLTFISDNVLVVKEIKGNNKKTVTIEGVEYCAANVVPGINVNAGGTVNISAISTKTGVKSTLNFVVGEFRTLQSFEIGTPSDVVADGESVELPFTALDKEGNKMTNFEELANQSDFSKLSFNTSIGTLVLGEEDDGSAKLVWTDGGEDALWNKDSTNGIDRPISLTAIVVGGETSNQMIYVQDKARPEAIANVKLDKVLVDQSTQKISLCNFEFLDQYGRNMTNKFKKDWDDDDYFGVGLNSTSGYYDGVNDGYVFDNGFFGYAGDSTGAGFTGTDFSGYTFNIGIELSGADNCLSKDSLDATLADKQITPDSLRNTNNSAYVTSIGAIGGYSKYVDSTTTKWVPYSYNGSGYKIQYNEGTDVEPTLKFVIQKKKSGEDVEEVSKKVSETFKVEPLSQLSNFTVDSFDKFNVVTTQTEKDTGVGLTDKFSTMYPTEKDTELTNYVEFNNGFAVVTNEANALPVTNYQTVTVKGVYNGTSVEIPHAYFEVATDNRLLAVVNKDGKNEIQQINPSMLQWKDLYDNKNARLTRKDASDTVEVNVHYVSRSSFDVDNSLVTVKQTALISDASRELSTITANDTLVIHPTSTVYYGTNVIYDLAAQADSHEFVVKDQYNDSVVEYNAWKNKQSIKQQVLGQDTVKFSYLVKDIVENPNGYVSNNFTVDKNSTDGLKITGAELGDTFTLEVTVKDEAGYYGGSEVVKTVKVTVGADVDSRIVGSDNLYKDNVRVTLQDQLDKLLKTN